MNNTDIKKNNIENFLSRMNVVDNLIDNYNIKLSSDYKFLYDKDNKYSKEELDTIMNNTYTHTNPSINYNINPNAYYNMQIILEEMLINNIMEQYNLDNFKTNNLDINENINEKINNDNDNDNDNISEISSVKSNNSKNIYDDDDDINSLIDISLNGISCNSTNCKDDSDEEIDSLSFECYKNNSKEILILKEEINNTRKRINIIKNTINSTIEYYNINNNTYNTNVMFKKYGKKRKIY